MLKDSMVDVDVDALPVVHATVLLISKNMRLCFRFYRVFGAMLVLVITTRETFKTAQIEDHKA